VARSSASGTWVALLRGINLASRNRVPMAGLRELYEELGCEDVKTYIASGNVVFRKGKADRDALAAELQRAVKKRFGVDARVTLRTPAELAKVVRAHPFGKDTSNTFVSFLLEKPEVARVRALAREDLEPEQVKVVGTTAYLRYPDGLGRAQLTGARLEKRLGVAGTVRNWRTVARLAEMAAAL
jgi:uncharacterized protein (DUF1697 family)